MLNSDEVIDFFKSAVGTFAGCSSERLGILGVFHDNFPRFAC